MKALTHITEQLKRIKTEAARPTTLVWIAIFFSIAAAFTSDFAISWGASNVIYELATIAGLIIFAYLQNQLRESAWMLALGGAVFSTVAALCMQAAPALVAPGLFILLRFSLASALVYAFWKLNMLIGLCNSYAPFTLCALIAYSFIAIAQRVQILTPYFSLIYAALCGLAAVFLFFSRNWPCPQNAQPESDVAEPRLAFPRRRTDVVFLAVLLIAIQFYSSFDIFIFSQLSQSGFEDYGATFPLSIALLGIGYFLSGLVAQRRGLPVLFVMSCTASQFFLLMLSIPANNLWVRVLLPLHTLSSAGIDLCIILFPFALFRRTTSLLQSIAGVVLFRIFKLYLIPSLFPQQWQSLVTNRLVFILAALFALGQMLLIIHLIVMKKNTQLAQLKQQAQGFPAYRSAQRSQPLPASLTPREKEVFELLLAGKDRGDIAGNMGISPSTVNKHCVAIYRKTDCSSHLELLSKYRYPSEEMRGQPPELTAQLNNG